MKLALVLALGGCYWGTTTPRPAETIEVRPAAGAAPGFVLDQAGLGSLQAGSSATLEDLRAIFEGLDIQPDGTGSGFVFNVRERGELLFYVVPVSSVEPHGKVYGIHVTSKRIPAGEHGWRVGDVFFDRDLIDHCECWGSESARNTVAACYRSGEHVAVLFERGKRGLACVGAVEGTRVDGVLGTRIDRLVWQPDPWGGNK